MIYLSFYPSRMQGTYRICAIKMCIVCALSVHGLCKCALDMLMGTGQRTHCVCRVCAFSVHCQSMICAWYVHGLCMVCAWSVHGMCHGAWSVLGQRLVCLWHVQGSFMVRESAWPVHHLCLVSAWFVHGMCMVCLWFEKVHCRCMVCAWPAFDWLCELSMWCLFVVCAMCVSRAWFVHGLYLISAWYFTSAEPKN
jgi:hypothetical protein